MQQNNESFFFSESKHVIKSVIIQFNEYYDMKLLHAQKYTKNRFHQNDYSH